MSFFDLSSPFWATVQAHLQTFLSIGSCAVTGYFWLVRINREREAVRIYQMGVLDGTLESGALGVWTGKLMLANRSIMPTGIVAGKAELYWKGRWLPGTFATSDANELPWNLSPQQVVPQKVVAIFAIGEETTRERVYEDQRIRFTFLTVEGRSVVKELQTNVGKLGSRVIYPGTKCAMLSRLVENSMDHPQLLGRESMMKPSHTFAA